MDKKEVAQKLKDIASELVYEDRAEKIAREGTEEIATFLRKCENSGREDKHFQALVKEYPDNSFAFIFYNILEVGKWELYDPYTGDTAVISLGEEIPHKFIRIISASK